MVFNDIFNNISVTLQLSVLLVEKTIDLLKVTDKLLSNSVVSIKFVSDLQQVKVFSGQNVHYPNTLLIV